MSVVVIYGSEAMCGDFSFCFVDLGIWEKAACIYFFLSVLSQVSKTVMVLLCNCGKRIAHKRCL